MESSSEVVVVGRLFSIITLKELVTKVNCLMWLLSDQLSELLEGEDLKLEFFKGASGGESQQEIH